MSISYNNKDLRWKITNIYNPTIYDEYLYENIDIVSIAGDSRDIAYVGFTGSTGGSNADKNILSWLYYQYDRGEKVYKDYNFYGSQFTDDKDDTVNFSVYNSTHVYLDEYESKVNCETFNDTDYAIKLLYDIGDGTVKLQLRNDYNSNYFVPKSLNDGGDLYLSFWIKKLEVADNVGLDVRLYSDSTRGQAKSVPTSEITTTLKKYGYLYQNCIIPTLQKTVKLTELILNLQMEIPAH